MIEALVTIVIFAFIAGGVYATMVAGDSSWNLNSIQIELQQELRKAMNRMIDDLQQSGRSAITDVPADGTWYDEITFYKTNGVSGTTISWNSDTTQFLLGGASGDQLQKVEGSTTTVVAQNISSLQIRRLSTASGIVEVSLEAEKDGLKGGGTVSDSLDFKVNLRN
ncbi:MAG: hypothetical protein A3C36_03035 [Omnitrophica WOR_2 bacterium RIFCSPHIGHO2_02_FULL_52_10]|nr:MAG: hypothetical protein A3C36_03035 [Omnitrophica WOR_2 bacterium RIFCSPHIGHO2_02_FULL_52_10]